MINYPFAAIAAIYAGSFTYLYHRCSDRLPLHKYFSNHVLLLAPLNFLFTFFIEGPAGRRVRPEVRSRPREDQRELRGYSREAKVLLDTGVFQRPPAVDEPGYNTFEKGGWRHVSSEVVHQGMRPHGGCGMPENMRRHGFHSRCSLRDVHRASAGAKLGRHHDPVASSLRYHLGLLTPNSEQCALTLDGINYAWRDGEELLFDQTYLHSAINRTDIVRVILFCDVEKTQLRRPVKRLADAVNYALVAKFTGANDSGKLSWVSWAYKPIYKFALL